MILGKIPSFSLLDTLSPLILIFIVLWSCHSFLILNQFFTFHFLMIFWFYFFLALFVVSFAAILGTGAAATETISHLPLRSDHDLAEMNHDFESIPIQLTRDGKIRYCEECVKAKPNRTRHCGQCKKCIPKFDHHCPFIGRCVGHANQKLFLLFLVYGLLYCIFILSCTWSLHSKIDLKEGSSLAFNAILLPIVAGVFGFCLLVFAGSHLYYVLTNSTTIETISDSKILQISTEFPPIVTKLNIYDLGSGYANFIQVFGPRWWLWPVPIPTALGNGVDFPINQDTVSQLFKVHTA
jgi:hypothetical protein